MIEMSSKEYRIHLQVNDTLASLLKEVDYSVNSVQKILDNPNTPTKEDLYSGLDDINKVIEAAKRVLSEQNKVFQQREALK